MSHTNQKFELVSEFAPAGDQPKAIESLIRGIKDDKRTQVLLGVTGSGKTFTMANVIQQVQKPTLVLSHNKTLAAQLYGEFREFFPNNAVTYFVSYYDYYQPEAYIPQRDIYIEKDASINEEIDRLRLLATSALVSRNDVIVVASVSCIYGLGSPKDYLSMMIPLHVGQQIDRDKLLMRLIDIHYDRNDFDPARAKFRVRGDVIECWPAYEEFAYRIELWGDVIEKLSMIDPVSGRESQSLKEIYIYPAKHFVLPQSRIDAALDEIREELDARLETFRKEGKLLEAQRLAARTRHDLELMKETGFCPGIENYSRALAGRKQGEPPYTLYDFFPEDFLIFVDESHATLPQIRAMHAGDVFAWKAAPFIDDANGGSPVALVDTLQKLLEGVRDVDTVIPGHMAPTTWAALREFAEFNRQLLSAARAAKAAGRTLDQAMAELKLPARFDDYLADRPIPGLEFLGTARGRARLNVELIYKE